MSTNSVIVDITPSAPTQDKPENKEIRVRKRDGVTTQEWDNRKIEKAIKRAFDDVKQSPNGDADNLFKAIEHEAHLLATNGIVDVEQIQDVVKRKLMDYQYHAVAEAYIVYSHRRTELRKQRPTPDIKVIKEFIHLTRYAKWQDDKKRREITWEETSSRSRDMHISRYPQVKDLIAWAYEKVDARAVLPSMRSMQFGGAAQLAHNAKGYNCAFSLCNRIKFFSEAFYLLLAGTGTGYSVQYRHVEQLPSLSFIDRQKVKHFIIDDTIESWADSLHELIMSYVEGYYVEFAYHKIRPQGSRLKTSGGRAPGHIVLRQALENVRALLYKAQGRQLMPIECYDIACMTADAVYSGGIREAATICLFSHDDGLMMLAKTGDWGTTHPWRARSNNSVVLVRGEIKKDQYRRVFNATKQWGEPGFFFCDDPDTGANPCVEIGLNPKLEITPTNKREIEKWAKKTGRSIPKLTVGDIYWGWQACNLSEVNCAICNTPEEFYENVRAATIIGTCQAGYTDFPYLGWVSEAICSREALLGVSLTGMMDKPEIALDPEIQRTAAQLAVETNIEIAEKIGINPAARVTCVKPSGTASTVVGMVGSGIHPHHARRYFRRIRANPIDPVYQLFKKINPHMCITISQTKELIIFPVKAPDGALTRHDFSAVEFLEKVRSTMINWVLPGTARPNSSPGINHNVSNTISVKPDEWDAVMEFIWKHKKYFTGVSLLGYMDDKKFQNAPREEVVNNKDEAIWIDLIRNYQEIDWTQLHELEDNTDVGGEVACAGGACTLAY